MKKEPVKILIIDDERVICEGCQLVLSALGYSIEFHLSGHTGLDAIRKGEFDLILLDMKLPDLDGMEILKAVRKEKPNIAVIIMTGYSTVQNAVEAMKLGAIDYITKPFTDDEIILAVGRAVEKKRLLEENLFLRKELFDRFSFNKIVGENPKVLGIFDQIKKVAPMDSTVLLYGESGTGKELFARAIHTHSRRAARQFVAMDCSTLSPNLLESELFGHVKGAFTGATEDKAGIFEIAHDGTLFLDDVANLNMEIQGKLLRVLEVYEYKPVGASHIKKTNVRIIAATNRDLRAMVDEGSFREDLFYRFNVFPIFLPPLRERKDDIPMLAYHFLRHFCRKTGKKLKGFSDDALEILVNHAWPGNVRQLKNVIERLVIMADHHVLNSLDLLEATPMGPFLKGDSIPDNLEELKNFKKQILDKNYGQMEKAFLIKALKLCHGNISHAAERVGMQRSNFSALMKKHHLPNTLTKD
ncbi:sigma-54-dependent transcriptional regulator [Thermodesulfobacteriota bacterium]